MSASENYKNDFQSVPNFIHESDMARLERIIKRLWIIIIILSVSLCGMFIYEAQFGYISTTETVTQECVGDENGVAIVNNGGGFNYGESKADDNENR